ncbi:unnamed protein product [Didymodactylos carnosus]|uniref:Uncharacterized protein n=1 Tax=Didymodactylos carnosus TaxID=1234261 RepID=A0A813XM73_9BILA|nr:unnamed protein product [Didymodactylos carnosus]CAF1067106.1 unnamed protein product [Didymodactylos carnosus]CAF3654745.1 unnamed protein product [Didymodactylos carnosus]CAF3832006.1 unnamed protein product [Didymodactylos carnosus]
MSSTLIIKPSILSTTTPLSCICPNSSRNLNRVANARINQQVVVDETYPSAFTLVIVGISLIICALIGNILHIVFVLRLQKTYVKQPLNIIITQNKSTTASKRALSQSSLINTNSVGLSTSITSLS